MRDAWFDPELLWFHVFIRVRINEVHHVKKVVSDQGCEETSPLSEVLMITQPKDPLKLIVVELDGVL